MNKCTFLTITSLLVVSFLTMSMDVLAAEESYPFTLEGVNIEILRPVSRVSDGLIKITQDELCSICGRNYTISARSRIRIASTGIEASAVELAEHVHKQASVQITGPGKIGGFNFAE